MVTSTEHPEAFFDSTGTLRSWETADPLPSGWTGVAKRKDTLFVIGKEGDERSYTALQAKTMADARNEISKRKLSNYIEGAANLVVDGLDESACFAGDGERAPFVVFDVDRQINIAGPFASRDLASQHRLEILSGHPPHLDSTALSQALTAAENGKMMKTFEVTGCGFDGATDETDDRVFWVKALSHDEVRAALAGTKAGFHEINGPETDIDFHLPVQADLLKGKLLEFEQQGQKLSNYTGQANVAEQGASSKLHLALEKLVPHVLHYASMPHAHADAHRDAADARRVLADFAKETRELSNYTQRQEAIDALASMDAWDAARADSNTLFDQESNNVERPRG